MNYNKQNKGSSFKIINSKINFFCSKETINLQAAKPYAGKSKISSNLSLKNTNY